MSACISSIYGDEPTISGYAPVVSFDNEHNANGRNDAGRLKHGAIAYSPKSCIQTERSTRRVSHYSNCYLQSTDIISRAKKYKKYYYFLDMTLHPWIEPRGFFIKVQVPGCLVKGRSVKGHPRDSMEIYLCYGEKKIIAQPQH